MKIVVSLASCANNTERQVLRAMYEGIVKHYKDMSDLLKDIGAPEVMLSYDVNCPRCDVAVQFGALKERTAEHHQARHSIKENARSIVYVETPLLGRRISDRNLYDYYRVGVNGFLNGQGTFYLESDLSEKRLDKMLKSEHIKKFPGWKDPTEGSILILPQLPGDASLRGQKMAEWLLDTIDAVRAITQRHILVRLHPAMSVKGRQEFLGEISGILLANHANITWLPGHNTTLQEDLEKSGVCINYSSGSSIDAVLQGVPVIAMDEANFAWPISSHTVADITDPYLAPDDEIEDWLVRLANSQWTPAEMSKGLPWAMLESVILEGLEL